MRLSPREHTIDGINGFPTPQRSGLDLLVLPKWGDFAPSKKRLPPRQPPDSLASNDALAASVVHPYLHLLLTPLLLFIRLIHGNRDEIRTVLADPQIDGMERLYDAIGEM